MAAQDEPRAKKPTGAPLQALLSYTNAKEQGPGRWRGRCPCHDDDDPSFDIAEKVEGFTQAAPGAPLAPRRKLLIICRAAELTGCTNDKLIETLRSLGLWPIDWEGEASPHPRLAKLAALTGKQRSGYEVRGAPPDSVPPKLFGRPGWRLVARYDLRTAAGALMAVRWRFEAPEAKASGGRGKMFRAAFFDGRVWRADNHEGGKPGILPLYGLHELALKPGARVLLVEGEKTRDAAAALFPDFVVVSFSGLGRFMEHDYSALAHCDVTYWPDADPEWRPTALEHVTWLAARVATTRLVELPAGLELVLPKWDLADAVAAPLTPELVQRLAREAPTRPQIDIFSACAKGTPDLIERFVFVGSENAWFARDFVATRYDAQNFDRMTARYLPAREKSMTTYLTKNHAAAVCVPFAEFRPGEGPIIYLKTGQVNPPKALNLYQPNLLTPLKCTDAEIAPHLDHVEYLLGQNQFGDVYDSAGRLLATHNSNGKSYFHGRTARMLQFPIPRPSDIYIIIGETEGTGKSMLVDSIRPLIGYHLSRSVNISSFDETGFNSELFNVIYGVIDELGELTVSDMTRVGKYITGSRIEMHAKHRDKVEGILHTWLSATTNLMTPAATRVGDGGRRIRPTFVVPTTKESPEYFTQLGNFYGNVLNQRRMLWWYLNRVDVSQFNPQAEPVQDDNRRQYEENQRNPAQIKLRELWQRGESVLKPGMYVLTYLHDEGRRRGHWTITGATPQRSLLTLLRKAGIHITSRQIGVGIGKKESVAFIGDPELTQAEWITLASNFEKTAGIEDYREALKHSEQFSLSTESKSAENSKVTEIRVRHEYPQEAIEKYLNPSTKRKDT